MNGVNMNSITVKIPLATYGKLATAAALDGMDITAWTEAKVKAAAIRGTLELLESFGVQWEDEEQYIHEPETNNH